MKKNYLLIVFMALAIGLTGCSSMRIFGRGAQVAPGEMRVVLVNTVDSKAEKTTQSKKQFEYGDMVYAYMTLGWDQNNQARTIDVKWRNSAGAVMAEQDRLPKYTRDPHHVWFWINTAQLGKGFVSSEILIDGQSAQILPFEIVDAKRFEVKNPWYQRLFQRLTVNDTAQAPERMPQEDAQPNNEVQQLSF